MTSTRTLLFIVVLAGCGSRGKPTHVVAPAESTATDGTHEIEFDVQPGRKYVIGKVRRALPRPFTFGRVEDGITVEPPGTRARARSGPEGDGYAWFLWRFSGQSIEPGPYETSEDGRRIEFEAKKGSSYAISLLVLRGGKFETHQIVWKYGDGPSDPPPPPDPPVAGLSLLAKQWAEGMSQAARAQARRIGGNWQIVGAKLGSGNYSGRDWAEQTDAAISELSGLNKPEHADWAGWKAKWQAEMQKRMDNGTIKETVKSLGEAFVEIGIGLMEVT